MTTLFRKKFALLSGLFLALSAQTNGYNYDESTYCGPEYCNSSCEIFVHADLLYWRPELCGLEGAFGDTTIATTVGPNAVTTTTITESDEEPHSKWNAGFRVGADVTLDCLDVAVDWTHFDGRAKFNEHRQHGRYNIKYDVLDLTFGRRFYLMSCLSVKPFIGIRGAQIHQKLHSHLETLFTSSLIGNNTVLSDQKSNENFWGLGPQIGLNADWYLGCDFSLYGSLAVVTYYGNVKGKSHNTDTFTSTVSACNGKRKHCFNNIATDAALGIRWDKCTNCFCGCDMNLMLKLGLEQHRIYDFSDLGSDGTLSLDGGVLAAGVSFQY